MPEIKNNFLQGKMNQDLDERLIPNGQYRDAMNIEVATSEEAGAGTIQNILGNTLVSNDITMYDSCVCVGSIADEKNNKLYWFIHCNDRDAIIEYDEILNKSQTILCDIFSIAGTTDGGNPSLQPFLKFTGQKITGINIIDEFIFWTDGNSEPKKVNVKKAKEKQKTLGTGNGQTINHHSRYWGLDNSPFIREEHLTVVRKKPSLAPKIIINNSSTEKSNSNRIFEKTLPRFCTRYKYADGEYSAFSPFTQVVFNPITKDGLNNYNYFSTEESYNTSMINAIDSVDLYGLVPSDVPDDVVQVDVLAKVENSPNVYSVKNIKRTDDEWNQGKNLFVEDLGTVAPVDSQIYTSGRCRIKSENIHAILPQNQTIRPWDAVPKKALAQEITGNRIVYGNYTQGNSLKDVFNNDITINLLTNVEKRVPLSIEEAVGLRSLKSQRSYKLGVVFADEYGRETPILTSDTADIKLPWQDQSINSQAPLASTSTMLSAELLNNFPFWAHSHKFYVKEVSGEYYNLVMLKAYVPGSYDLWDNIDKHVWIAFASSDRNKISEESFLTIKKLLNPADYDQVAVENKYKILDIANEAPDAIKFNYYNLGSIDNSIGQLDGVENEQSLFPSTDFRIDRTINDVGLNKIHLSKADWINISGAPLVAEQADETTVNEPDDVYISWRTGVQNSARYKVISVSSSATENYIVKLATKISFSDANMARSTPGSSATSSLNSDLVFKIQRKDDNDGEDFSGKFFVKIQEDSQTALSGAVGSKGEEGGVEEELYVASMQSTYYFANDYAGGPANHTEAILGATTQAAAPSDNPADIHTGDNLTHTSAQWDALLDSLNSGNGTFFIDRMYYASAAFGTSGYARNSGLPHGCGTSDINSQAPNAVVSHREFEWNPLEDARTSLPNWIFSEDGNFIDIYQDDSFQVQMQVFDGVLSFADQFKHFILTHPDSDIGADESATQQEMFGFSDEEMENSSNYERFASRVEKCYGWSSTYKNAIPTSVWHKEGALGQQVSGLEGIIESTDSHTSGIHRWKSSPYSSPDTTLENVYEENGKYYMYISFLGPGVDLHDGSGLLSALSGQAELNGRDGISKYMQGIWGGGVFTKDTKGEYHENYIDQIEQSVDSGGLGVGNGSDYQNQEHSYDAAVIEDQEYSYPLSFMFPTEFGTPTPLNYYFMSSNEGDERRRKMHVEFEGNHDSSNEPLPTPPGPGVSDTPQGYDDNYADQHYNQWNPAYGHPNEQEISAFLYYLNYPNSKFRFANDTTDTVYTIQSVTKKRLYNHTPWRRRYIKNAALDKFIPAGDSVEEAAIAWADTCGTGVVPSGNGGTANDLTNKIIDFGSKSNRRVVYIIELDQNPIASTDFNPLANIDVDTPSNIEFLSSSAAQVLNTQLATYPAIMETEAKDVGDLELYYEASDSIPTRIRNTKDGEVFAPIGCKVELPNMIGHLGGTSNVRLRRWLSDGEFEVRVKDQGESGFNWNNNAGDMLDYSGQEVKFIREDGSYTTGKISLDYHTSLYVDENGELTDSGEYWSNINTEGFSNGVRAAFKIETDLPSKVGLNWYNCFTFEDGVESNRIRDDFNAMQITNGAKVSTVLEEPYAEEHRKNGMIYSGVYNSNSGVNNLNQFISAEKITKDLNPTYGSIQKLYSRSTDLVALCEDRIIKVLANKDALFNADGTPQLIATENVLGQAIPFVGDYGISKNPESFASESYRAYFTDKQRGAVLRLSMDGLTPISDSGMHDWFRDYFHKGSFSWIGSYDNYKKQYNLTISEKYFNNIIVNSSFDTGASLVEYTNPQNIVENSEISGGTSNSFPNFQQYIYTSNDNDSYNQDGTSYAPLQNTFFNTPVEIRYYDEIPAGSIFEGGTTTTPGSDGPTPVDYSLGNSILNINFENRSATAANLFNIFQTDDSMGNTAYRISRTIAGNHLTTQNDWSDIDGSFIGWANNESPSTKQYAGGMGRANVWLDQGGFSGFHNQSTEQPNSSDGIFFSNLYFGDGVSVFSFTNFFGSTTTISSAQNATEGGYYQLPGSLDNYVTLPYNFENGAPQTAVSSDVLQWNDAAYTTGNGLQAVYNNVDSNGNFPLHDFSDTTNFSIFSGEEIEIEFKAKRYGPYVFFEDEDGNNVRYDNCYRFFIQLIGDGEVIDSSFIHSISDSVEWLPHTNLPSAAEDVTVDQTQDVPQIGTMADANTTVVKGPWNVGWCDDSTIVFDEFLPESTVTHKAYFKFKDPTLTSSQFASGQTNKLFDNLQVRIGVTANENDSVENVSFIEETIGFDAISQNQAENFADNLFEQGAALESFSLKKVKEIETPGIYFYAGENISDVTNPPIPSSTVSAWAEVIYPQVDDNGTPQPYNWNLSSNSDNGLSLPQIDSGRGPENPGNLVWYSYQTSLGEGASDDSDTFGTYSGYYYQGESNGVTTYQGPDSSIAGTVVTANNASGIFGVDNMYQGFRQRNTETYNRLRIQYTGDSYPPIISQGLSNGLTAGRWYMVDVYYREGFETGLDNLVLGNAVNNAVGNYSEIIASGNTITSNSSSYPKGFFGDIKPSNWMSGIHVQFKKTRNYQYGYAINDSIPGTMNTASTTQTLLEAVYDDSNYGNYAGAECYRIIFQAQIDADQLYLTIANTTDQINAEIANIMLFDITQEQVLEGAVVSTLPSVWTPVKGEEANDIEDLSTLQPPHTLTGFVDNSILNQNQKSTPELFYSNGSLGWITREPNTGWSDKQTVLPNSPTTGGYRVKFEVSGANSNSYMIDNVVEGEGGAIVHFVEGSYDPATSSSIVHGSLSCKVICGPTNSTGVIINNIKQPGEYQVIFNPNEEDVNNALEDIQIEIQPANSDIIVAAFNPTTAESYSIGDLESQILFSSESNGFIGNIDNVYLFDSTTLFEGGQIDNWSLNFADGTYSQADGLIVWDNDAQALSFNQVPSQATTAGNSDEVISVYQTLDTSQIQVGQSYSLSFNYDFENQAGVSFYFILGDADNSVMMYGQTAQGSGYYSNTFQVGGSTDIVGVIPENVIYNSLVFQPSYGSPVNANVNGSIDNVTLQQIQIPSNDDRRTISFSEDVNGWVSFKSFLPESGLSLSKQYYTMKGGELYKHYTNEQRNSFYGQDTVASMVKVVLNTGPSTVKSFNTISFEGTAAEVLQYFDKRDINFNNQVAKNGWSVSNITTDLQEGYISEFIKKEGKWFNYIKGNPLQYSPDGDGMLNNKDIGELNFQGIGVVSTIQTVLPTSSLTSVPTASTPPPVNITPFSALPITENPVQATPTASTSTDGGGSSSTY